MTHIQNLGEFMNGSFTFQSVAALVLLGFATACATPVGAPATALGPDRATGSDASAITWTDGQPAYSIKCDAASGCQTRAAALCNNGPSRILSSENLPTAGNARATLGPPSVVVRCG